MSFPIVHTYIMEIFFLIYFWIPAKITFPVPLFSGRLLAFHAFLAAGVVVAVAETLIPVAWFCWSRILLSLSPSIRCVNDDAAWGWWSRSTSFTGSNYKCYTYCYGTSLSKMVKTLFYEMIKLLEGFCRCVIPRLLLLYRKFYSGYFVHRMTHNVSMYTRAYVKFFYQLSSEL